ncbi:undecaprenyl-phosphate glucose phosphotransferase [Pseudoalteromonas denitrificans]|uniref:Putative colanic acid biosysnthesis UDP-glucose lipid carrier transferase n=1 Tax=Pseudoalteromonas denitrificans DSM 6059 TaxID=1123010 RepID=A0A1I1U0Z7_9GAMM|nr:undecaprenyl-phosphate glucose phosphotransferase [Pseudoalteromonas denitrificans]SFD64384.1 putative colanic acid biosysnthesis UDP-glucose lipid carrier transferase [Pseudoalteromonas denitrificans DSM 6059]
MNNSQIFKTSSNSDFLIYRLLDSFFITLSLILSANLYGLTLGKNYLLVLLVVLFSFLYFSEALNLYRSWRAGKFRHMVTHAWGILLLSFLVLLVFAFGFKLSEQLSRVTIALWFVLSVISLFSWRFAFRVYKLNRIKMGLNMRKVAIIGATQAGANIYNQIKEHDELGYDCIGFFEDREPSRYFEESYFQVAGSIEQAIEMAKKGEIDVIFLALPFKAEERIANILANLGDTTADVHIVPDFLMSNLMHARIDHVGDLDTLSVFESPYFGSRQLLKRTEDIIAAIAILVLISPVLAIVSLGVKLTSKGPVLFKQDRYGLGGEHIKVWKFRSMSVQENSCNVVQATKNDVRITKFGAFLRRTSLDELPQFINVITGDMSIVGPRPHAVSHNEEYRKKVEFYMLRHKVKPGITGWAQINGWRGETDTLDKMEKRVEFDFQYIKHWSLWFDIKIIFLTVFKGFTGKNAY